MICIFTKLMIDVSVLLTIVSHFTLVMCDKGAVFTLHLVIFSVMGEDLTL